MLISFFQGNENGRGMANARDNPEGDAEAPAREAAADGAARERVPKENLAAPISWPPLFLIGRRFPDTRGSDCYGEPEQAAEQLPALAL